MKKKPVGILELLGLALGRIRLSYDDFCKCTPVEFEAICKAWKDGAQAEYKEEWERIRVLATITIQPHVKGKVNPKKMLSFPWDKVQAQTSTLTPAEQKKRFKELIQRLKT